jgi:peptidoglycan DL-endopeptidase CwlO
VTPSRRHPARVLMRQSLSAILGILAMFVLSGTHAYADPSISDIEAQLAAQWAAAEPLIEQYNKVHDDYEQNLAKQATLEESIKPLQLQVDLAQIKVGAIAEQAYESGPGGGFTAMLQAGSPGEFADQLLYLDQIAAVQDGELADVMDIKARYDAAKAPIDALVNVLTKQDADLAAQRKVIDTKIADLQTLRVKAYGNAGFNTQYRPWTCPAQYLPTKGYQAAAFACAEIGKPYVFGAAGPNTYDCSGLTLASWKSVGVYMPHNAYEQSQSMPSVKRADIQIGDLVFYYSGVSHVAIYVGDGHIVNAPQPGDHVRMANIDSWPIHSIGRPG